MDVEEKSPAEAKDGVILMGRISSESAVGLDDENNDKEGEGKIMPGSAAGLDDENKDKEGEGKVMSERAAGLDDENKNIEGVGKIMSESAAGLDDENKDKEGEGKIMSESAVGLDDENKDKEGEGKISSESAASLDDENKNKEGEGKILSESTAGLDDENKNKEGEGKISSRSAASLDNEHKDEKWDKKIMDRLYCPTCLKTFSGGKKAYYSQHMKTCGKGRFDCSICKKTFCTSSVLKRHVRLHLKGSSFRCYLCSLRFSTRFYLKLHLDKVHNVGQSRASHDCPHCCKKFRWNSSLSRHIIDNHCTQESLAFQCACGQQFSKYHKSYTHKRSCKVYQKQKLEIDMKVKEAVDDKVMHLDSSDHKLKVEKWGSDTIVAKVFKETSDKEMSDNVKKLDDVLESNGEERHKCQLCNLSFIEREMLDEHVEQCDPHAATFRTFNSYLETEESRKRVKRKSVGKEIGKCEKLGNESGHNEIIKSVDTSTGQCVDDDANKRITVRSTIQERNKKGECKIPTENKRGKICIVLLPANIKKLGSDINTTKRKSAGTTNTSHADNNIVLLPGKTKKIGSDRNIIKRKAVLKTNTSHMSHGDNNASDIEDPDFVVGGDSGTSFERSRSGRKRKMKAFDDYETDFCGLQKSFKREDVTQDCLDQDIVIKTEVADNEILGNDGNEVEDHGLHGNGDIEDDDHEIQGNGDNEVEKDSNDKMGKTRNTCVSFLCPLCTEADESLEKIQAHIMGEHDLGKLSWIVLSEKYSKMWSVDKDPASRIKWGQTICPFCKLDWPTTKLLKLHVNRKHAYFPYCCGICRLAYGTKEAARFHMKKYHIKMQHVCTHCQEVFRTIRGLRKHVIEVHKRKEQVDNNENISNGSEGSKGEPSSSRAKEGNIEGDSVNGTQGCSVTIKEEIGEPAEEGREKHGTSVADISSGLVQAEIDEEDESVTVKPGTAHSKVIRINENEIDADSDQVKSTAEKDISEANVTSSPIVIKSARVIPKIHVNDSNKNTKDVAVTEKGLKKKKEINFYKVFDIREAGLDLPNGKDVKTECYDCDGNIIDTKEDIHTDQTSCQVETKPNKVQGPEKNVSNKPNDSQILFDFSTIEEVFFKCCFENCGKLWKNVSMLRTHLSNHIPDNGRQPWHRYECLECSYSTVSKTVLKAHILIKHNMLESVEIGMEHCKVVDKKTFEPVKVIACVYCGFLKDIQHFATKHKCNREKVHFYCLFCDKKDPVFEKLQEHIKEMHSDKTVHRPELGDKFLSLRTAVRDPAYSINSTDTTCEKCKQEFKTNDELKSHVNEKHNLGAHSCGVCRQCYVRPSATKEHMKKTHVLPMVCRHCQRGFGDKADLARHEATHLQTKPFLCELCPSRYSDRKGLKVHYNLKHQSGKPQIDGETVEGVDMEAASEIYICDTCGLTFQTLSKYKKHARNHEIDEEDSLPQFKCELCSKDFISRKVYSRHLCSSVIDGSEPVIVEGYSDSVQSVKDIFFKIKQNPPPGSRAKVRCGLCKRDFNTNKYMYNHIRQVHLPNEGRKMHCGICGYGFSRKAQLQSHMRSHSNSKPFRCRICGKSYRQLGHIRVHLMSHSKKFNFKCKLCPQVFKAKSSLGNHILLHSDIFPYKCLVMSCEKAFASLQNLLIHVRHCDVNKNSASRFECKLCSLRLDDLKSGLSHMKGHGKDALYKCSQCSQDYMSYKKLYEHKADSNHFSPSEVERAAKRSYSHQKFTAVEVDEEVDLKTLQQQFDYTPDDLDTETGSKFESEVEIGHVEETEVDNVIDSDELMDIAQQLTHMAQGDVLSMDNLEIREYASDQGCIVEQVEKEIKAYTADLFTSPSVELPVPRTKECSQISSLAHGLTVIDDSDLLTDDLLYADNQNTRRAQYNKLDNRNMSKVELKQVETKKTTITNTKSFIKEHENRHVKVLSNHPVINESAILVEKQSSAKTQLKSSLNTTAEEIDYSVHKTSKAGSYENHLETGKDILASSKIFDESGREVKVNVINEEGCEIPIQNNPELLQALLTTGNYTLGYGDSAHSTNEYSKDVSYLEGHTEAVSDAEVIQKTSRKIEFESMDFSLENNAGGIEDAVNIYVINEENPVVEYSDPIVTNKSYDTVQKTKKLTSNKPRSERKLLNMDKVCGEITDKEAQVGNSKREDGQVNYKVRLCYYEDRTKQEDQYPLECDICQHRFRRIKDLNQHKKRHLPDDEKQFQCKQCGKGFTTRNTYVYHMYSHSGERPHKCNHCDKRFRQLGHLQTHLRTHADYRPFKCTHCEKTFVTNVQLRKHVEKHGTHFKKTSVNGVACQVCGNFFAKEKDLKIHRIKHMSAEAQAELIKNYNAIAKDELIENLNAIAVGELKEKHENLEQKECMCDVCGKLFSRSKELSSHKVIHFNGPKVACKECGKEFVSERRLQTHITQTHSVERYQCDTCGKQLKSISSFYTHKRVHKGPRYQCTRCQKTFHRKYLFLQHMPLCIGDEFMQKIE